jgi:hypothetical protein
MNRHLLTRRVIPVLVASLSLGIAGTANASNASVQDGVLTINETGSETNIMLLERVADVLTTPPGGTPTAHQVIIVRDSDGSSVPDDLPGNISPGTQIPMFPIGAGCVPEGTTSLRCTSDTPTFTKVVASLGAQNDYFGFDDDTDLLPPM